MPELNTTSELDLDAWLATGARTTHTVNLFTRMDLLAELDELKAQLTPVAEIPVEASIGGDDDPNAELNAEILALQMKIYASKKVFRVTAVNEDEIEAIRREVREEMAKEIDAIAARGKAEAHRTIKRMDMKVPSEINLTIRAGIKEYTDKFIAAEVGLRMVAKAAATQGSDGMWQPLSLESVRSIRDMLGDRQVDMLANACGRANNDNTEVTPSKS